MQAARDQAHVVLERNRHVAGELKEVPPSPGLGAPTPVPIGRPFEPATKTPHIASQPAARPPCPQSVPAVDITHRQVEPMLLVHQERMETFRLLARFIKRGARAIAARFTST